VVPGPADRPRHRLRPRPHPRAGPAAGGARTGADRDQRDQRARAARAWNEQRPGRPDRLRRGRPALRARRRELLARRRLPPAHGQGAAMIDQIRAELLKIRSTRTTLGLVAGMVALIVFFALLTGLVTKAPHLTTAEDQRGLLNVGSIAGLFSALAGVM